MGTFGISLAGLLASQKQLQSVSNNLANISTVGYKDQTVSFSDLFAQSSMLNGIGDPLQQGLGVQSSQTVSNFTDGTTNATGVSSNMALSGNGFFVVQTKAGATDYTRAGDFTTNTAGQLVTPTGALVMGRPAVNGVVNGLAALQPLTINSGMTIPATATTTLSANVNLQSSSAVGATFSSTIPVYDSLGTTQQLTVSYTKTAANTWNYTATMPGATTQQVGSGTLSFDSSGNLTSPSGSVTFNIPSLTDGAAGMNLTWNLNDSSGNATITQTDTADATTNPTQNGFPTGTLSSYSVSSDGTIQGTFTNGTTLALGQVAVANFSNTQGLQQLGGNLYGATAASGTAQIGIAGTSGLGSITGGSTENSNVDVATEFGKMIVAQQAYQANAKSVTTLDSILQTTINMLQS